MTKRIRQVHLSAGGMASANESDPVWVGDRVVARCIEVEFPGVDGQPRLSMTIDSSTGVPRVSRLLIEQVEDGREVRTSDLRAVELANWIEAIVPAFMHRAEQTEDGGLAVVEEPFDQERHREAVKGIRTVKRAERRKIDDAFLRRVAEIYKSDTLRPADAVQRAFPDVNRRTAYRYISLAREAGFLPPKGEN